MNVWCLFEIDKLICYAIAITYTIVLAKVINVKNIVLKNADVQMLPVFCENLLEIIPATESVGTKPTQRIADNENDGNPAAPVL